MRESKEQDSNARAFQTSQGVRARRKTSTGVPQDSLGIGALHRRQTSSRSKGEPPDFGRANWRTTSVDCLSEISLNVRVRMPSPSSTPATFG
ncbi:uncharacterized protein SCHCODRAFT_02724820 [Schizophyllum commune H4-8]|uniref:uncharacterized protein n=1 Tax=Schizophyllum commune (strain H4-8 / FGSC 9210) TaxID=578458 RepID=UPI0021606D63|nr:uncharacterized protein SCHCODRAFT_02724820 [Schizophyllum commune H4-8]KAI5896621.1 hypothetical protein SCHCODRAFT_02724820 [Schizophyllum commune H4-8]